MNGSDRSYLEGKFEGFEKRFDLFEDRILKTLNRGDEKFDNIEEKTAKNEGTVSVLKKMVIGIFLAIVGLIGTVVLALVKTIK